MKARPDFFHEAGELLQLLIPTTRPSLLNALRADESELAWGEFLEAYLPLLQTWSRRASVPESDLEDLLAEIYTHLIPRLRRFVYCPDKRFRGWLRRSVASAIANFRDSRQRQLGIPVDQELLAKLASTDEWEELGEEFELAFAERLAVANRIASAVKARVKPDNWDAFYLTYVEGLDCEEVSARLGISKGTIHIARCRIRAMLIRAAEADGV